MKVRLRSLENRETLGIQVPVPCSLRQLKLILSQRLSSSPHPDSVHLSLNRKDEIQSSSPDEETLHALGIASGDLIFFTVGPNCFSSQTLGTNSNSQLSIGLQERQSISTESQNWQNSLNSQVEHIDEPESSGQKTKRGGSLDGMDIDDAGEDNDGKFTLKGVGDSFSVPGFLRKVFADELGGSDDGGRCRKLLVIAVHAVLLESGFVGFDMNLKTEITRCQFQEVWPSNLSLFYTLPGLVGNVLPSSEYQNGVVTLKFQSIGTFLNVYGSLKNASAVHSVRLREDELVSFLNIAWANCGLREEITGRDGISSTSPAREVFSFWKIVKDNLALPLLIDLCERAGLELPPCFMRLPTDLKLKILESLPGVDIARMSCVSSKLRYLCSSGDLWKRKFVEQFGPAAKLDGWNNWKEKFAKRWESSKRTRMVPFPWNRHPSPRFGRMSPRHIGPLVFRGDYDILGNGPEFYPLVPARVTMGRSVSPHCRLYNRN